MEFRNITTFLTVVERGGFTKAAETLGYVQSTVTAQIKQLEAELGFPLFDRVGKRAFLTSAGMAFVPYAEQLSAVMNQAKLLGATPEEMRGTLRLGVLESLLHTVILQVLPDFSAAYPKVNLQIRTGHMNEILSALKKNEIDLAYISGKMNDDPLLTCCYRRTEQIIFVTNPQNPLLSRRKVPLKEIVDDSLIFTEMTGVCYQYLNELCILNNIRLDELRFISIDSTHGVASYLAEHPGTAFLPEYSLGSQLENGTLRRIDADVTDQYYYTQVLTYRDKWIPPYASAFLDAVCAVRPEN